MLLLEEEPKLIIYEDFENNTTKAKTYVKKDKTEENEIKIYENFKLFLTTLIEKIISSDIK